MANNSAIKHQRALNDNRTDVVLAKLQEQTRIMQETSKNVTALEHRLEVLEESADREDVRWAKIKKIRSAIQEVCSICPPVDELTLIAAAVIDYSEEFDVEPSLILAVIHQESNFQRKAHSHAGAQGLMQVMSGTSEDIKQWLNIKYYNPWKVRHNIQFGTLYLARMLHQFDNKEELALAAYNAGPLYVEKVQAGEWKSYPTETQNYIEKVITRRQIFLDKGITK